MVEEAVIILELITACLEEDVDGVSADGLV
jgi:hypothetical protein